MALNPRWLVALASLALAACAPDPTDARPLRVGSKAFTESVILGELLTQSLEHAGVRAEHARQLGGSRVLFEALTAGEIDAYVEYTGTLTQELLRASPGDIERALASRGIRPGPRLGFENTYALAMLEARARDLEVTRIGDLPVHPELRYAISHELLARRDGFTGLRDLYELQPQSLRAVEHALAYRAIDSDADVIDVYTTDPEIEAKHLRVLEDERGYFPEYAALVLLRVAAFRDRPRARRAIEELEGRLDTPTVRALNGRATSLGGHEATIVADLVGGRALVEAGLWARISARTVEHVLLVGTSLLAALLVALPLGVAAAHRPRLGRIVLAVTGVLQTLPSLALLVLLIPLLGIGTAPAACALFLYSLLPIVQNTHAGLRGVDVRLLESATVIGLSPWMRLRWVELPLALPTLVAGVKTAAVINVGTATLGALVGAGGYGQPILTGVRLHDMSLVVEGAAPACILAIAVQLGFDLLQRRLTSRGVRVRAVR